MGDFEKVKEVSSLKDYAEEHLEKVRGGYVCPLCQSGKKANGTPALSIQGERWKCFSAGCNAGGDIFDLAGAVHDTQNKREQLQLVADWAGISLEGEINVKQARATDGTQDAKKAAPNYTQGRIEEAKNLERWRADLWKYPDALSYLRGRGFNDEEIRRFGFGCYPSSRVDRTGWQEEGGTWVNGLRLVIPWKGSGYYHNDRAITEKKVEARKYLFPDKAKVGERPLYNPGALDEKAVFIVEGPLDALAVEACGYPAIALGGGGHAATFRAIESRGYTGTLILMLDSGPGEETKGQQEQANAAADAKRKGLAYYCADFHSLTGRKDACEVLAEDRETLAETLARIEAAALEAVKDAAEQAAQEVGTLREQVPAEIAAAILECKGEETPIPTGIKSLDRVLNGGLRSGLFVLGAVSSGGKTTLFVQIADYIAANGKPVLFVSCEQSGRELVGKSLSRMMAQRGFKAVTLWEMGRTEWRTRWPQEKEVALSDAVAEYMETIAPNLHIMAGIEQPSVENIKAKAEAIRAEYGTAPVVLVDYLQLLKPTNDRYSDKQATDANISDLRRMAWTMHAPVMMISSLNRASYAAGIEMASFKESGGVEYGADVLAGLQPYQMAEKVDEHESKEKRAFAARKVLDAYRKAERKESEIVILKNRSGRIPANPLPVTFHAASSLFVEGTE